MSAWLIAIIIFFVFLAAAIFLPSRIRLQAQICGAFARGEARVGILYGLLGIKLCFSAYKGAGGRYEARVWRKGRPEKIYSVPQANELIGIIRQKLEKRGVKRAQEHTEQPKRRLQKRPKARTGAKNGFRSRLLRRLIKNARVQTARISGTFGTGNAAATALAIGAASGALKALLAPIMKMPPSIDIAPDFSRPVLNLELACIVNLNHGKSTLESI